MTEILKSEAIILKKLDYGDTSKIAIVFTEKYGKITCILKGARSPKSKTGSLIDSFNHVEIVFYKKKTREIQIITQADLIKHYTKIIDDLEKLKYASAIIELIDSILLHDEPHELLFKGTVRIFDLISESNRPDELFLKYFLFFLKEIGYDLNIENCDHCGAKLRGKGVSYNSTEGLLCNKCSKDHLSTFQFSEELFEIFYCLSKSKKTFNTEKNYISKLIGFLENYLRVHVPEFKRLNSLHLY